jgi:hypothetical protein
VSEHARAIPDRLHFRSEVGADSPLWTEDGAMVDLDDLPIPRDLQEDLQTWAEVAWRDDSVGIETRGRALLAALRESLDDIELIYGTKTERTQARRCAPISRAVAGWSNRSCAPRCPPVSARPGDGISSSELTPSVT